MVILLVLCWTLARGWELWNGELAVEALDFAVYREGQELFFHNVYGSDEVLRLTYEPRL